MRRLKDGRTCSRSKSAPRHGGADPSCTAPALVRRFDRRRGRSGNSPQRNRHFETSIDQREHHGESGAVSDELRVLTHWDRRNSSRRIGQQTTSARRPVHLGHREPEKGFEPLAPALQERCSDQLSYSGSRHIVVAGPFCGFAAGRSVRDRMPSPRAGATL